MKFISNYLISSDFVSHPTGVRGLKSLDLPTDLAPSKGRTPLGCVD